MESELTICLSRREMKMPRKSNTRAAAGSGTIRQRKDGTWEARYTVGRDPGTGKQIQRSIYGKTQKEVRQRLQQANLDLDRGIYSEPIRMTVGKWLDIWLSEYCGGVKEHTLTTYETQCRVHIKPALGALKLSDLKAHHVQAFLNSLYRNEAHPLSAKTVKNIHGVLHRALDIAVRLQYVPSNPCGIVQLQRSQRHEIRPLEARQINDFLAVIRGSEYETLLKVDLFTGMRQSEIMGLTWDRIDFKSGIITIDRQLVHEKKKGGEYKFAPMKTDQIRKIKPAPTVMKILQQRKAEQAQQRLLAGSAWDTTLEGLVFTNALGQHYSHNTLTHNVRRFGEKIGVEGLRFHDLRHTYAVSSIRAGDDIKTISSNLGHTTISITLDIYAHFTDDMRNDSAARMESYLSAFSNL